MHFTHMLQRMLTGVGKCLLGLLRLDLSENEGLTLGKSGKKILMHMSALTQIRACAAPHMDAAAPLRLADELFKVASARQQQVRPLCPQQETAIGPSCKFLCLSCKFLCLSISGPSALEATTLRYPFFPAQRYCGCCC